VPDPVGLRKQIQAGVFAGRLMIKLIHPKFKGVKGGNDGLWVPAPIALIIPGRRVVGFDLIGRQAGQTPRVGRPASVEVRVETVACPLGQGTLALDWTPEGEPEPQRLLQVPLPLPVPIWDPVEVPKGWACHRRWDQEPIVAAG